MATTNELLEQAKCFGCYGLSQAELLQLALMLQIATASESFGNPPVVYVTDPNTELLTPFDTTQPAVAYSEDGSGAFFGWRVATQTWV